jgi:hypothetical protein
MISVVGQAVEKKERKDKDTYILLFIGDHW